ncbi:serine/threonine protein kinase, partial [bacterium]|nr:serine/threonine protein kinase [bacterium]
MLITFACTACGNHLEIDTVASGREVECPHCHQLQTVPRRGVAPGTTLGGFKIEKLLGRGGMGEVYLARQISLDRPVALKILPAQLSLNKTVVARFLNEVRLLARLEHAHIVTAFEAGEDDGVLYYAMGYVKGQTLEQVLMDRRALGETEALTIVRKLAEALEYAWTEHQLLHRDIKPSNVLIDGHGEPKLVDLGLARSLATEERLTVSNTVMGTPNYMSPEQVEGRPDLDYRADMYSLGMTLYHLVTGQPPFESTSVVEVLKKQLTESLPDPRTYQAGLSEGCVTLLERLLAKDRTKRPETWAAVVAEVNQVLTGQAPAPHRLAPGASVLMRRGDLVIGGHRPIEPAAGPAPTPASPPPAPAAAAAAERVPSLLVPAGLVAVIVLVVVGGWWWLVKDHEPAAAPGAAPAPAPTVASPASAPAPAAEPSPVATAWAEAQAYARAHPDDFGGIISRLQRVQTDGAGTTYTEQAARAIRQTAWRRDEAIALAQSTLKAEVEQLVKAGQYAAALEALAKGGGALGAELADQRVQLTQWVTEQQAAARPAAPAAAAVPAPDPAVLAKQKLAELTQQVADTLLHGHAAQALALVTAAGQDPALAPVREQLLAQESVLREVAAPEQILAGTFERQQGTTVEVALAAPA